MLQAQELVSNENILLQTLGFDVAIDHPHTHVVKCCQLVKGACAHACLPWSSDVWHSWSLDQCGCNVWQCNALRWWDEAHSHYCASSSIQGAGTDVLLHGDKFSAPDDHVPALSPNHCGLRLHSPRLQMVKIWDSHLRRGTALFFLPRMSVI